MRLLAKLLLPLAACAVLLSGGAASALDPARTIAQYKHTRWTVEDGVPPVIAALAQGADGYLWIGSSEGLYRFDGVSFEHIAPQQRSVASRSAIIALLAASDGHIWAGYRTGGVAVFRGGVLQDAGISEPDAPVIALVQTADGAIWAGVSNPERPLVRLSHGRWEQIGANWGMPRDHLISMLAARDGTLWVTTLQSVVFLKPGATRFERAREIPAGHAALSEDLAGRIWLSDLAGSRAITGASPRPGDAARIAYPTPGYPRSARALFDRDGNLWTRNSVTGILRVRSPAASGAPSRVMAAAAVEQFRAKDGLTSDNSYGMLEDREGNIWVGSALGLDRFRAAKVVAEPELTRLPAWGFNLLGASDGAVYVGQADSVYRIRPGGRPEPLLQHLRETEAICEGPDRSVWVVLEDRIVRIRGDDAVSIPRPPTKDVAAFDCAVDRHNALWVSAVNDGMFQRTASGWRQLMVPREQHVAAPGPVIASRDGRLIVYIEPDFLRWIDYPTQTDIAPAPHGSLRGLSTIYEGRRYILLAGAFGLARQEGARTQFLSADRHPAFAQVTGVVQTPAGGTWLIGKSGIVQVPTDALERAFDDPRIQLRPAILDVRDGLPGIYIRDGKRDAVRGGDGRLWFATTAGVVWVDPARLSRNPIAPRVVISALKAGGATYRDPTHVTLPKGTSSGQIDYTALSLTMPDRVQFRYRLEGMDAHWIDPGARRQMFFTNLGPGAYRFQVIASNNDGVWNRQGATLEFVIPPTFVQSKWFLLLCALLCGAVLWFLYAIRVRQVTARVRAGLEVRLAERERIARELHDTLLQGFQGLVLRFQSVADRIPHDAPLRPVMDDALDRADAVLIEGRDRVHELRNTAVEVDLAQALIDVAGELTADHQVRFNLTVEGRPRDLHPMVREEVQRIGEEAIRNAFQHARATAIEASIAYRRGQLRLDIRDDGVGLSDEIASAGERPGHYGLIGMRERALRIGGLLNVFSRKGAGTEILLSVPGRSAYAVRRRKWRLPLVRTRRQDG